MAWTTRSSQRRRSHPRCASRCPMPARLEATAALMQLLVQVAGYLEASMPDGTVLQLLLHHGKHPRPREQAQQRAGGADRAARVAGCNVLGRQGQTGLSEADRLEAWRQEYGPGAVHGGWCCHTGEQQAAGQLRKKRRMPPRDPPRPLFPPPAFAARRASPSACLPACQACSSATPASPRCTRSCVSSWCSTAEVPDLQLLWPATAAAGRHMGRTGPRPGAPACCHSPCRLLDAGARGAMPEGCGLTAGCSPMRRSRGAGRRLLLRARPQQPQQGAQASSSRALAAGRAPRSCHHGRCCQCWWML